MTTLLVSNFHLFNSNCTQKQKKLKLYKSKTLPFFIVFPYNFAANTTIKGPKWPENKKESKKRPKCFEIFLFRQTNLMKQLQQLSVCPQSCIGGVINGGSRSNFTLHLLPDRQQILLYHSPSHGQLFLSLSTFCFPSTLFGCWESCTPNWVFAPSHFLSHQTVLLVLELILRL